jgi:large subunit ribosomal protein L24
VIRTIFHVKKKDVVQVMSGKEKGKTGKVLRVIQKKNRIVVEKLNMVKRHTKPTGTAAGGILEKEAPLQACNVLLFCEKCARGRRTSSKTLENKKTVRICRKCNAQLDK